MAYWNDGKRDKASLLEDGAVRRLVYDEDSATAIKKLEKQMKIMNIHLSMMTDNEITKAELD